MQKVELLPPINKKVGEFIDIDIPSNPTTGFNCLLSEIPACVYFVESSYEPDHSGRVGSGGTSHFKFIAVSKGSGPITFHDVKFSHPPEIREPTPMQKRFVKIE